MVVIYLGVNEYIDIDEREFVNMQITEGGL